jgi:hypothetical protein
MGQPRFRRMQLDMIIYSNDLKDRLGPFEPDQLLWERALELREPVGVEAQLMQDRSVEVLDMEAVLDRVAPNSSVLPTLVAPLIAPPAIPVAKPNALWSRPVPLADSGAG